jgi:hypothetical protein
LTGKLRWRSEKKFEQEEKIRFLYHTFLNERKNSQVRILCLMIDFNNNFNFFQSSNGSYKSNRRERHEISQVKSKGSTKDSQTSIHSQDRK